MGIDEMLHSELFSKLPVHPPSDLTVNGIINTTYILALFYIKCTKKHAVLLFVCFRRAFMFCVTLSSFL